MRPVDRLVFFCHLYHSWWGADVCSLRDSSLHWQM